MTVLAGEDFADVRVVIVDNGSGHMRSFSPVSVGPTFFLKNRVRRDIPSRIRTLSPLRFSYTFQTHHAA